MAEESFSLSIYKAARKIKKESSSLYNALRSIYDDSAFVAEIAGLWPELPLVANLRCGLWYAPRFHATCYFKSTDGHQNNWSFSTARLNLHLALLSGQRGGCIIVDSTRKGKRFPDSMSKTIPIWCSVLNRAIKNHLETQNSSESSKINWDTSLHLPLWVPQTERASIESLLPDWTADLESCGADISSLTQFLKKPLQPLWISQNTLIWLNEVPSSDSWDFTPVILVSASGLTGQKVFSEFSFQYIPGAGDDEESWARGMTPDLFWNNAFGIIDAGPALCNKLVSEIVERERVYRAQRGEVAGFDGEIRDFSGVVSVNVSSMAETRGVLWVGSSNIAVGSALNVSDALTEFDCVLNCENHSKLPLDPSLADSNYLNLSIVSSKLDRFSLYKNLSLAVDFAKSNLSRGRKLLVCCQTGEDISVCVCLAILTCLFDDLGNYDGGRTFSQKNLTKWEMRKKQVYICKFTINARPSRGNLKQVFAFLNGLKQNL